MVTPAAAARLRANVAADVDSAPRHVIRVSGLTPFQRWYVWALVASMRALNWRAKHGR